MKKIVDLTMHIYEGMGIGRVYPNEQEFIIEDVYKYETHGIRLSRFIIWQEPGTRLNLGSIYCSPPERTQNRRNRPQ